MTIEGIKNLRRKLRIYQQLGYEHLPFSQKCLDLNTAISSKKLHFTDQSLMTKSLQLLRDKIGDCKRCNLFRSRNKIVFGEGSNQSGLMFIGEAPGRDEDIQGKPFVGRAGELLTSLITKMGLKRKDVYIANVVKCRPPGNRDPEPHEIGTCKSFLIEQIAIIKPSVIIALGRIASQSLLETTTPISALRGKVFQFRNANLIPTFHPAYLLRNRKDKHLTWKDAQKALKILSECSIQQRE